MSEPLTEHMRRALLRLASSDGPISGDWQEATSYDRQTLRALERRRMVKVNDYFRVVRVTDVGRAIVAELRRAS